MILLKGDCINECCLILEFLESPHYYEASPMHNIV